jgi:hypothetical protein
MANNVPVESGSIGKAPPRAMTGGGVETGPPSSLRYEPSGNLTPKDITAENGLKGEAKEVGP